MTISVHPITTPKYTLTKPATAGITPTNRINPVQFGNEKPLSGLTIFVCEDDNSYQKDIKKLLGEIGGATVLQAYTLPEANEILEKEGKNIHFFLLDGTIEGNDQQFNGRLVSGYQAGVALFAKIRGMKVNQKDIPAERIFSISTMNYPTIAQPFGGSQLVHEVGQQYLGKDFLDEEPMSLDNFIFKLLKKKREEFKF